MCENNQVGRLNSLGFIGFQDKVEDMLKFKARNSDPLRFPNYYKVLYSWHISRGNYRSGMSPALVISSDGVSLVADDHLGHV